MATNMQRELDEFVRYVMAQYNRPEEEVRRAIELEIDRLMRDMSGRGKYCRAVLTALANCRAWLAEQRPATISLADIVNICPTRLYFARL